MDGHSSRRIPLLIMIVVAIWGFLSLVLGTGPTAAQTTVEQCQRGVELYVKRSGMSVSRRSFLTALEICERTGGDEKAAVSSLPSAPPKPKPAPVDLRIESFRVVPDRVRSGAFVSFHWHVEGADLVTLIDDFGVLEKSRRLKANGEDSITVRKTTTFRLVATDRRGRKVESRATVRVLPIGKPPRPQGNCCPPEMADRCDC